METASDNNNSVGRRCLLRVELTQRQPFRCFGRENRIRAHRSRQRADRISKGFPCCCSSDTDYYDRARVRVRACVCVCSLLIPRLLILSRWKCLISRQFRNELLHAIIIHYFYLILAYSVYIFVFSLYDGLHLHLFS